MTPATNIHVVVTLADGDNEYDTSKVYLDDMDEDSIDYNNNNLKGIRMFREIINKLRVYQKHQKRQTGDTHNKEDYTWNTSPANERYSSSSSSSSNSSPCSSGSSAFESSKSSGSSTFESSKSNSTNSLQTRLDNITGYFKFININGSSDTRRAPTTCKQQTIQKKLLRSPTAYMYIKGMSGLHSRVPKY
uniref:DUF4797 domain-containing protein n=1 Tax=Cacopsylla melanoneura TaxID=428564 RepID=A0A8D8LW74_9HEMI